MIRSESTRRSFLKGLGLATAGLILLPDDLPRRFWAMGAPLRLWGDGIHDDAPALQAILDGRGAMVAGAEGMYWPGGLTLRRGVYTYIIDARLQHR
jgi:hypothetical protein